MNEPRPQLLSKPRREGTNPWLMVLWFVLSLALPFVGLVALAVYAVRRDGVAMALMTVGVAFGVLVNLYAFT